MEFDFQILFPELEIPESSWWQDDASWFGLKDPFEANGGVKASEEELGFCVCDWKFVELYLGTEGSIYFLENSKEK